MLPVTSGQPVFTADELLRLPSGRARYELVRGELRVMTPAGHLHGKVAMRVGQLLAAHVDANQLGIAYAAETGFVLSRDPDTVRAPDAAFVTAAHLASVSLSPEGYFPGAPDLAILPFHDLVLLDARTGRIKSRCRFTDTRSYGFFGLVGVFAGRRSRV